MEPRFDSEGMTNCEHGTYLPDGECGRELDELLEARANPLAGHAADGRGHTTEGTCCSGGDK